MLEHPGNGSKDQEAIGRKKDPEAAKANILEVATSVFAEHGLSGARVDEIAARTETSKRMIYYYFGSKEDLYRRVLEECYRRVRAGEADLELGERAPTEALRALVEFTFDHHKANPDFVRLVMIENIHHAEHLVGSEIIQAANRGVIEKIGELYAAGVAAGEFRDGLHPKQIHWFISALAFFNVSNRSTFSGIFGWPDDSPSTHDALREEIVESVLRYVAR